VRKILSLAGLLIVIALFFTGMTLGVETDGQRESPASLPPVGIARGTDQSALESVFGLPVPRTAAPGSGSVTDAPAGSLNARLYAWEGSDGLLLCAVRPAEAASLLRREELTLNTASLWTVSGETVTLAAGNAGACAYFDNDDAAFSIYLPGGTEDELLGRIAATVTFPHGE